MHRHVLRDVYPTNDAWGDGSIIPTSPLLNTNYLKNNTFTLSTAWKAQDVSLVAFVSYYNANTDERVVLNAAGVKLNNIATNIEDIKTDASSLVVYPNPTSDIATVEFNLSTPNTVLLSVRDIAGKEVMVKDYGMLSSGVQKITIDAANLTNGIYFASMKIGEKVITKKISINK